MSSIEVQMAQGCEGDLIPIRGQDANGKVIPVSFTATTVRGDDDVASPLGEWTRVECICREDQSTVKINGKTVNQCYDVYPAAGHILLENEKNEI